MAVLINQVTANTSASSTAVRVPLRERSGAGASVGAASGQAGESQGNHQTGETALWEET